jgi:hypothetical protein
MNIVKYRMLNSRIAYAILAPLAGGCAASIRIIPTAIIRVKGKQARRQMEKG